MPGRQDFATFCKGFLMGSADIVPGVSGGTVALVVGIYNRLVTAISRFDLTLLHEVRRGRFADAAERIDLRFLVALGAGVGTAILTFSSVITHLMTAQRQHTYAAFFGLILGSSVLVAKLVPRWTPGRLAALLAAAGAAFAFVGLPAVANPPAFHPGYLFLCGFFAICAMILPGVSGAFLLLVFGAYAQVLELLHRLKGLSFGANDLFCLVAFCGGMGSGLVCFTKLLRWLLARYEAVTMAALTGFMLGSLRKLWPFQNDLTPGVTKFAEKSFAPYRPDFADGGAWTSLLIAAAACAFVIVFESLAARRAKHGEFGEESASASPPTARMPAGRPRP